MKSSSYFFKIVFLVLLVNLSSCDSLQQMAEIARISQCKFEVQGVSTIKMAGFTLQPGMKRTDLSGLHIAQLSMAIANNKLPLAFDLGIKVVNPNDKQASLSRMDYIILIDGIELLAANVNQRYEIAPKSATLIALPVEVDLFKVLKGESGTAISNLGFKLTGSSDKPVSLIFRVKPYIKVGGLDLAYPGFIDIAHTL